jgi:glycerophosphoryl diester phosphodiesterase
VKVFDQIPAFIVHRAETMQLRLADPDAREILAITNWVEVDVRRSSDGVLVVFHDETIPAGERVGSLRFDYLSTLGLRSLENFVSDLPSDFSVILDVKNSINDAISPPEETTAHIAVESARRIAKDRRVLLTSFDPSIVADARQENTSLNVGLTTWQPVPLRESIPTAHSFRLDVLAVHIDVLRPNGVDLGDSKSALIGQMGVAHQAGLQVACWGGEEMSESDIDYLVEIGIDAIYIDKENLRSIYQQYRWRNGHPNVPSGGS